METGSKALTPGFLSKKPKKPDNTRATKTRKTEKYGNKVVLLKIDPIIDVDAMIKKHGKKFLTKRSEKELQVKCNAAEKITASFAAKCKHADKTEAVERLLIAAVKLYENGWPVAKILPQFPSINERTFYRAINRKKKNQPVVARQGRPEAQLPLICMEALEEERAKLQSNATGFVFKNFKSVVKANIPDPKKNFTDKTLSKLMNLIVPAITKASMTSTLARAEAQKNLLNYISWAVGLTAMLRRYKNESVARQRLAGKEVDPDAPFLCLEMMSNIDSTSAETYGSHTVDKTTEKVHTTEVFKDECRARGYSINKPPKVKVDDGKHYR